MLAFKEEERVMLVVCNDMFDGGEGQYTHDVVAAIWRGIDVEVLAAAGREGRGGW